VNVFTTGGEQPTGMLKGLMVPLMTYFPLALSVVLLI